MRKKKKELTEKQQEFIACYQKNAGNVMKICNELHISIFNYKKYMSNPMIKETISKSVETARKMIEVNSPYLVELAMTIIQNEEVSLKIRSQLIDSLLDRAGIVQQKEPLIQVNNINHIISNRAREILAQREKAKELPTIDIPLPTAETAEKETADNQPA